MNNRYLVAKYAPDLNRMEPENIGVFLWSDGAVAMRFLKEKDAPFIEDKSNYRRWPDFWRVQATSDQLSPLRGVPILRSDPGFMDVLRATQEGNYLLFDGGRISTPIATNEIEDAAAFLFDEIVSRRRIVEEQDTLVEIADRVIQDAGLYDRVETQYRMNCKLFGVPQDVIVNYAIVDETPKTLLQRVSLRKQQTAYYAALIFNSLVDQKKVRGKKHCASLVNSTESDSPTIIKMLGKVSTVVDLADPSVAAKELRRLAA
jgi:hypothetical protein